MEKTKSEKIFKIRNKRTNEFLLTPTYPYYYYRSNEKSRIFNWSEKGHSWKRRSTVKNHLYDYFVQNPNVNYDDYEICEYTLEYVDTSEHNSEEYKKLYIKSKIEATFNKVQRKSIEYYINEQIYKDYPFLIGWDRISWQNWNYYLKLLSNAGYEPCKDYVEKKPFIFMNSEQTRFLLTMADKNKNKLIIKDIDTSQNEIEVVEKLGYKE